MRPQRNVGLAGFRLGEASHTDVREARVRCQYIVPTHGHPLDRMQNSYRQAAVLYGGPRLWYIVGKTNLA